MSLIPIWLKLLLVAASLFAVLGLVITIVTSMKFGHRSELAPAAGSRWRGTQYALFAGMMPWAKESARQHLLTYFTGIVYHLGIACGFVVLVGTTLSWQISETLKITLSVLTVLGAVAGTGLLVKRAVTLSLRSISTPDDIISNGLVTTFLIASVTSLWIAQFTIAFLIIATLLLVYIPLGKIRHCFLFFCSRITFGRFFGRRGVLPHQTVNAKDLNVG